VVVKTAGSGSETGAFGRRRFESPVAIRLCRARTQAREPLERLKTSRFCRRSRSARPATRTMTFGPQVAAATGILPSIAICLPILRASQ
jgi:hypothetical protein